MPNAVPVSAQRATNLMEHAWNLTQASPIGDEVSLSAHSDRTVHIWGANFDTATVKVQGSNNNVDWLDLHDPQGVAISKTAAYIGAIVENPLYIRAYSTGGGAAQDVTVSITAKRGAY